MKQKSITTAPLVLCCMVMGASWVGIAVASEPHGGEDIAFPRNLDSYNDSDLGGIGAILKTRIRQEPFNLVAPLIFIVAILHTFMTSKFLVIAHKFEKEHAEKIKAGQVEPYEIHLGARFFHFFGEVEVVFAGVSIPKKYFANGIGAGGIFCGALVPIAIMLLIFLMIR